MQLIFSVHNPTSVSVRLQWLVLKDRAQGSGRLVMGKGLGGRTSLRSTLTSEPSSPTMPESFDMPPSRLYWAFPDVTGNPPPRPLLKPHGGAPVPDTARKHSVPTGVSSLHFSCNTACLRRKLFKGNYLYGHMLILFAKSSWIRDATC